MASLSESVAQIRVIDGSARNEFLRQRSLMYSNGVSFRLSAPRSSTFLTLKSSCNRRTANGNGVFPVSAVANDGDDCSSYNEAKRLAIEATERLMKEAARQHPIAAEDEVEFERFMKEAARRLVKEATDMFVGTSTQQLPDDDDDDADELKISVKAGRVTPMEELAIKTILEEAEDRRLRMEISKKLVKVKEAMAKREAMEAAERLVKEAADMFAGGNKSDNKDTMASGIDAFIDEVCGLIKPYLTSNRVQDCYAVGDYIWTRVRRPLQEPEVMR